MGFNVGTYVRVVLGNIPPEFLKHFNPFVPHVVGVVGPSECSKGYLNVRIKKHRFLFSFFFFFFNSLYL